MDVVGLIKQIKITHIAFAFLLLVAGLTTYAAANPYVTTTGYTEFYISGEDAAENPYPTTMTAQSTEEVPLVIVNREHSSLTYQLSTQWNGTETNQTQITLDPREERTVPITVHAPADAGTYKLEFLLETSRTTDTSLRTRLWITVEQ
jgi:Predicted membrane protein